MTQTMKAQELSPRQRLFVDEYLIDLNGTRAAIRAGYSQKTAHVQGSRLLKHVKVVAAIQEGFAARSQRTEVDQDYVLLGIRETIKNASDAGQHGTVMRGWELLGKHLGMFGDHMSIKGRIDHVTRPLKGYSEDELRLIIENTSHIVEDVALPVGQTHEPSKADTPSGTERAPNDASPPT